jgi:hypothetical protein
MPNYERPQNEPKIEQPEIDEETFREVITAIFFNAAPLKTTSELLTRIQEQATRRGVPVDKLEEAIMGDVYDMMANSVG